MNTIEVLKDVALVATAIAATATAVGNLLALFPATQRAAQILKSVGLDISQFISGVTGKEEKKP